jgi:hypothetical protein
MSERGPRLSLSYLDKEVVLSRYQDYPGSSAVRGLLFTCPLAD